jgi:hypothetical protein
MKYCAVFFDKYVNMAERIRNSDWENDEEMRQDLEKYVQRNLRREEILDFMIAGYPIFTKIFITKR